MNSVTRIDSLNIKLTLTLSGLTRLGLILIVMLALTLAACSSSDDGGGGGGGGGDTTPPTVVETDPVDGATDVALDTMIIIKFSKEMAFGSFTGNYELSDEGGTVATTFTLDEEYGQWLTITPDANLNPNQYHTVHINDYVTDYAGNRMDGSLDFGFTTGSTTSGGNGGGGTLTTPDAPTIITAVGGTVTVSYSYPDEFTYATIYYSTSDFTDATQAVGNQLTYSSPVDLELSLVDAADTLYYIAVEVTNTTDGYSYSDISERTQITLLAPPTVTALTSVGDQVTATWNATAGVNYDIFYATNTYNLASPSGFQATGGPFTASPATFAATNCTSSRNCYIGLARVIGNVTSFLGYPMNADGTAQGLYLLIYNPGITVTSSDGYGVNLTVNMSGAPATAVYEMYYDTATGVTPDTGTAMTADAADPKKFSLDYTDYFDAAGVELTYHFVTRAKDDSLGQNAYSALSSERSDSPALTDFRLATGIVDAYTRFSLDKSFQPTRLYWGASNKVHNIALDGSEDSHTTVTLPVGNKFTLFDIEETDTYYTYQDTSPYTLHKIFNGTSVTNFEMGTAAADRVREMIQDATNLYVSTTGRISRIAKSNMTETILASGLTLAYPLAQDGVNIYYSDSSGIHYVDKAGIDAGLPAKISDKSASGYVAGSLAVDPYTSPTDLYFIQGGSGGGQIGGILGKIADPTSAATATVLHENLSAGDNLFWHNDYLYFTNTRGTFRYDLDPVPNPLEWVASAGNRAIFVHLNGLDTDIYTGSSSSLYILPDGYVHPPPLVPADTPAIATLTPEDMAANLTLAAPQPLDAYFYRGHETAGPTLVLVGSLSTGVTKIGNGLLTNGTAYNIAVTPYNISGAGTTSATSAVTPTIAPPTSVTFAEYYDAIDITTAWFNPADRNVTLKVFRSLTSGFDPGGATPINGGGAGEIFTAGAAQGASGNVSFFYSDAAITASTTYYYVIELSDATSVTTVEFVKTTPALP